MQNCYAFNHAIFQKYNSISRKTLTCCIMNKYFLPSNCVILVKSMVYFAFSVNTTATKQPELPVTTMGHTIYLLWRHIQICHVIYILWRHIQHRALWPGLGATNAILDKNWDSLSQFLSQDSVSSAKPWTLSSCLLGLIIVIGAGTEDRTLFCGAGNNSRPLSQPAMIFFSFYQIDLHNNVLKNNSKELVISILPGARFINAFFSS